MNNIVKDLIRHPARIPTEILVSEIADLEQFEVRCYDVDRYFVNIWGIAEGKFEFCPDHDPPDIQTEVLPWLWILYPELHEELKELGNDDLRQMIDEYEEDLPLQ
jgi:hypothetical protein